MRHLYRMNITPIALFTDRDTCRARFFVLVSLHVPFLVYWNSYNSRAALANICMYVRDQLVRAVNIRFVFLAYSYVIENEIELHMATWGRSCRGKVCLLFRESWPDDYVLSELTTRLDPFKNYKLLKYASLSMNFTMLISSATSNCFINQ